MAGHLAGSLGSIFANETLTEACNAIEVLMILKSSERTCITSCAPAKQDARQKHHVQRKRLKLCIYLL